MPAYRTSVTELLRIYHGRNSADTEQTELPTTNQVQYLCNVGLGPIAFSVYGEELRQSDPTIFSVLQSADLTTRVIFGQIEKAVIELTASLQATSVTPTFLKGISTSDEFYAPHYLRVMSDIDILVQHSEVDIVMAKIADLGYVITDEQWQAYKELGHHHLPEARHPKTGISIEVHTGLFSPDEFYSGEYVFQPDIVAGQSVEFDYRGASVTRFTPEFQFIYTVSKWSVDTDWALNLKNINDTIHSLRKYESEFDWPILSKWFAASPHLYPIIAALLHYLEQADILKVSPQMHDALASGDHKLGPKSLKVLLWLLNTYPFNARYNNDDSYQRWFAHALWLYLTKPNSRDLGIPRQIMREFRTNAFYGKYNPLRRVLSGLKELVYRIRKKWA